LANIETLGMIQSDTFYKSFEIPLLEKYDHYRAEVQERQMQYEKETNEKSQKIRETEAENMRVGRKKQRGTVTIITVLNMKVSAADLISENRPDKLPTRTPTPSKPSRRS
jgi:hypothetical protein